MADAEEQDLCLQNGAGSETILEREKQSQRRWKTPRLYRVSLDEIISLCIA